MVFKKLREALKDLVDRDDEDEGGEASAAHGACEARPATSCHLTYALPQEVEECRSWRLESTVEVEESAPCTYFCVIGWGPAGYSGIQQTEDKRLAIFSMWHDGDHNVQLVDKGPGCVVSGFGGEGEGLKCMKDFDWEDETPVTFRVSAEKEGDCWLCSCFYIYKEEPYFMATYKRTGPRPLNRGGFYSFVEDWYRCGRAEGHKVRRRANFSGQRAWINGGQRQLNSARFSKVENGLDQFACRKAFGGDTRTGFFLSTGGDDEHCGVDCHNGKMLCK